MISHGHSVAFRFLIQKNACQIYHVSRSDYLQMVSFQIHIICSWNASYLGLISNLLNFYLLNWDEFWHGKVLNQISSCLICSTNSWLALTRWFELALIYFNKNLILTWLTYIRSHGKHWVFVCYLNNNGSYVYKVSYLVCFQVA